MTDRWDRTTALFGAARLLDSAARRPFLDAACGEDALLRAEVDRLLADAAVEDDFLEEPVWREPFSLTGLLPLVAPGDLLKDRYRVEAAVASGGQAQVFRATDIVLSRSVVVKVMRTSGRLKKLLASRFEQEMEALSRIDHPSVVGILDVGEIQDGSPFLVIQYVNGISLREALQQGPLDHERAARLLRELGSALSAAHAAGVAHQDLKPENIMLQRFDDGAEGLKLIDFGIAKIDRTGLDAGLTSVIVAGTVRYMAPEQFQGEHSTASDVFALALVVCEMLSGHPSSHAVPRDIAPRAKALIESALAFQPRERPDDVRRWSEELAGALAARRRSPVLDRWRVGAAVIAAMIAGIAVWGVVRTFAIDANRFAGRILRSAHSADDPSSTSGKRATERVSVVENVTGNWAITGILTVCGFLCGSPVGTVYHSTATFSQDTATTFHGTYFGYAIQGTLSGSSVSFGFDNVPTPSVTVRSECAGTLTGTTMTLKCSEYVRPKSGSDFLLNGSRTDTVVKK
jgi:serine/threonine protein kinase